MPQTRISDDVWQLGQSVAQARGLNNPRVAIEAIVRVYAHCYLQGSQPATECSSAAELVTPLIAPAASAKDALSHLIQAL